MTLPNAIPTLNVDDAISDAWVDAVKADIEYIYGTGFGTRTRSALSGGPPASPGDGDIWIATGVSAAGARWAFQYNAGSASAYKWEFIGGSPAMVGGNPGNLISNLSSVSAGWFYWVGTDYVALRAGDYQVRGRVTFAYNSAPTIVQMVLGGTNPATAGSGSFGSAQGLIDSTTSQNTIFIEDETTLAANQSVHLAYKGLSSNAVAVNASVMTVVPRRII